MFHPCLPPIIYRETLSSFPLCDPRNSPCCHRSNGRRPRGDRAVTEKNRNRSLPQRGATYNLRGLQVTITAPQVVGRRTECFWYPNIMRFANGTLAMSIRVGDDRLTADDALLAWSRDEGRTWSDPKPYTCQSFSYLALPSGEMALLPHHLYKSADGCKAPITIINSKGVIRRVEDGVEIRGFSWPFGKDPFNPPEDVAKVASLGRVTLSFNGTPLRGKDGGFLTIVYGHFGNAKRLSTLLAESKDGLKWRIRATIADEACKLSGVEGPCEACLGRLRDGRLMCVFRRGWETYGQCWSADEGKTWTEPVAMKKEGKVEPKLLVLPSGTAVLAGGRPGLYLWFDNSGTGKDWQTIDTLSHHNAYLPQEPIGTTHVQGAGGTSSYAGIVALDANTFLYVYDRVPAGFHVRTGWKADLKDAGNVRETFGVFITRVTVRCPPDEGKGITVRRMTAPTRERTSTTWAKRNSSMPQVRNYLRRPASTRVCKSRGGVRCSASVENQPCKINLQMQDERKCA